MSNVEKTPIQLNITLGEIDQILCKNCKKKLRELIKSKVPDALIEEAFKR